eukprot:332640-Pelagomonas_calceolata.AAC.3
MSQQQKQGSSYAGTCLVAITDMKAAEVAGEEESSGSSGEGRKRLPNAASSEYGRGRVITPSRGMNGRGKALMKEMSECIHAWPE